MTSLTGYGSQHQRLFFDGDETKYEQWEIKMLSYMRLKRLKKVILPGDTIASEDKKEEAFCELVQFLDDRSLNLVMRDAQDDGRKALQILRQHYAGTGKQRIISLYTQLTSLQKKNSEMLTDYIIRAETAAIALKTAGEVVSDGLLIAMVLKGLPNIYKPFVVVITQAEKAMTFQDFKVSLRNYEENEKASCSSNEMNSVMRVENKQGHVQQGKNRNYNDYNDYNVNEYNNEYFNANENNNSVMRIVNKHQGQNKSIICYACGLSGHKSSENANLN